jgi:uncharacterized damage-inducible protein DinB
MYSDSAGGAAVCALALTPAKASPVRRSRRFIALLSRITAICCMDAKQATFLLQTIYLPGLKNEPRLTKAVIEAIPLDKSDYRPDQISKSALDLAWHIVATENRFIDAVLTGAFDLTPNPRPDSIKNSKDLAAWYTENLTPRLDKLAKLSNEQLLKIVDFRGMFQLPVVMYLGFVLHHTVHHRGQLSMYLRPMGAKVPSIYGESHDAAEARKAAQGG